MNILDVQYLNDAKGNVKAVQILWKDWMKIKEKIAIYEQIDKVKSDLIDTLNEVDEMKTGKIEKQTFDEFLNAL